MTEPFSPSTADMCMQVAAAAYIKDVELVKAIFPSARVEFIINETSGMEVLLVEWDGVAIAAVRGTQVSKNFSMIDVIRNTRIAKRRWYFKGVRAHAGYSKGADSVMGQLTYWVDRQRANDRRVYLTGHSMGGVIASGLAAVVKFDATYTFGAPRFGNRAFAKMMKKETVYRIVHERDIAPSYPHSLLGYRHAGERWQLDRDGAYSQINGWSKDFYHYPYIQGNEDHKPANYVLATKKGYLKNV